MLEINVPLSEGWLKRNVREPAAVKQLTCVWTKDAGDPALLRRFPNLNMLSITDYSGKSIRVINELKALKTIIVNAPPFDPDFSNWPELEEIGFVASRGHFSNSNQAARLRTLRVSRWKESDLTSFGDFAHLRDLTLVQGLLSALNGIQKFTKLQRLSLLLQTSLADFSALRECRTLTHLRIDTCKKLSNLDDLSGLTNLVSLRIDNVGGIKSLHPLAKLTSLRELYFVESTNVADGDTAFLKGMHIEKFGFMNRRHYNFNYDHLIVG